MLDKCIALAIALSGSTLITADLCVPPQYTQDVTALIHFTDQKGIAEHCGVPNDPSLVFVGCTNEINGREMWIGNPCRYKEANNPNSYAHTMCHEIAHMNGWTHPVAGKIKH
jgi:hypothetical protein